MEKQRNLYHNDVVLLSEENSDEDDLSIHSGNYFAEDYLPAHSSVEKDAQDSRPTTTEPSTDTKETRTFIKLPRMCGSQRKRFSKWREMGKTVEEALTLSEKTWKTYHMNNHGHHAGELPKEEAYKRARSDPLQKEEKDFAHQKNKVAKLSDNHTISHASQSNKSATQKDGAILQVVIRNIIPMNAEQMQQVHSSLIQKIISLKDGQGPAFDGFDKKSGYILVTCENQFSQDWLFKTVPSLQPWNGASLSIQMENETPHPLVALTFIPKTNAPTVEVALQLIQKQNVGVTTTHWKILRKLEKLDSIGVALEIDDSSAAVLNNMDFVLKCGFSSILVRLKRAESAMPFEKTTVAGPSTGSICYQASSSTRIGSQEPVSWYDSARSD